MAVPQDAPPLCRKLGRRGNALRIRRNNPVDGRWYCGTVITVPYRMFDRRGDSRIARCPPMPAAEKQQDQLPNYLRHCEAHRAVAISWDILPPPTFPQEIAASGFALRAMTWELSAGPSGLHKWSSHMTGGAMPRPYLGFAVYRGLDDGGWAGGAEKSPDSGESGDFPYQLFVPIRRAEPVRSVNAGSHEFYSSFAKQHVGQLGSRHCRVMGNQGSATGVLVKAQSSMLTDAPRVTFSSAEQP